MIHITSQNPDFKAFELEYEKFLWLYGNIKGKSYHPANTEAKHTKQDHSIDREDAVPEGLAKR
jgi:hypothetical protein